MSDMATMAMAVDLDGPLPLAPPYGLLASIPTIPDTDVHWINGVAIWGYPPGVPSAVAGCAVGSDRVKDEAVGPTNPTIEAITNYLPFRCTRRSFRDFDLIKARLMAAFAARKSYSVEYELANGAQTPLSPYLGDADVDLPNGSTAVSPAEGLAIVEDLIGATGTQGVIHATPGTLSAWTNTNVNPIGGKLRTLNGNLVVAGGGYLGSYPVEGAQPSDDDQAWVYVTGPMEARLSEPFIPGDEEAWALDREDNTLYLYAEIYSLVTWDAELHAAVLIDRSIT